MKIAGQYTPFWGGQHARFLQLTTRKDENKLRTEQVLPLRKLP
jgi:hypothetical protein